MAPLLTGLPLTALVVGIFLYGTAVVRLARTGKSGPLSPRFILAFITGSVMLMAALLPPLDTLAEHSLAAHMAQHTLIFVGTLMLVAGRAGTGVLLGIDPPLRGKLAGTLRSLGPWVGVATKRATALAAMITILAFWHLPGPFDATLSSELLHGMEHASFAAVALLYWISVLGRPWSGRNEYGTALGSLFLLSLAGTAFGALLTFSTSEWYPVHSSRATRAGIDWLTDQQLAGLIMWVPVGVTLVSTFVILGLRWLHAIDSASVKELRS